MQRGAFFMIDALGFRDAWRGYTGDQIIARMHKLKKAATELRESQQQIHDQMGVSHAAPSMTFLSDTVVGGVPCKSPTDYMGAIASISSAIAALIGSALEEEPRLLYRGCITAGEYTIDGSFIVGEAVSRAAALYELAQGAFIWLDEAANAALGDRSVGMYLNIYHPWDVPMKGGDRYSSRVVTPFSPFHSEDERRKMIEYTKAAFERIRNDLSVQIKKQRTLEFLEAADKAIAPHATPIQFPSLK
jgi:hypothetical protein